MGRKERLEKEDQYKQAQVRGALATTSIIGASGAFTGELDQCIAGLEALDVPYQLAMESAWHFLAGACVVIAQERQTSFDDALKVVSQLVCQ